MRRRSGVWVAARAAAAFLCLAGCSPCWCVGCGPAAAAASPLPARAPGRVCIGSGPVRFECGADQARAAVKEEPGQRGRVSSKSRPRVCALARVDLSDPLLPLAGKKRKDRRDRATIPHLGDDRRGRRERRLPATPKNEASALLCRKFTRGPRHDAASPREGRAVGAQHESPGLRGGPRRRRAGGDFYPLNHARVSISEVLFPGSRPRGLPAPPPGASGPPVSRDFTLRGARTGVPHANWATWLSNMPRFCGPAGQKRRAAREPNDMAPQRTDKTRQNRRTRLRFLDSVSLFAARDVESP